MSELKKLSPDSRLWIFMATERIEDSRARELSALLDAFLEDWNAHGKAVRGAYEILDARFILVAADEAACSAVSGCSIDSLQRAVRTSCSQLGISLNDHSTLYFRGPDGGIGVLSAAEIPTAIAAGSLTPETPVYQNAIRTLGEMQQGCWIRTFRDSYLWSRYQGLFESSKNIA